jgi:hypothetical protein
MKRRGFLVNKYLGVKLIEAEPMTRYEWMNEKYKDQPQPDCENEQGYKVVYPDGYVSWSPKGVFEKAYMCVGGNNTIEERNVNDFVKSYDVKKWGDKTTIVVATLANGFIMSESSSCVDAANFNMDIGYNICKERIQNRVWEMLGFMLQSGVKGIK